MKSRHANLFILSVTAFTLVGCANFSGAQTSGHSNDTGRGTGTVPHVSNEAFVLVEEGRLPAVLSLDALREMSPPQIKLVFDCDPKQMEDRQCEENFSSELPESLDQDIDELWQKSIVFNYRDLVEKFPDAQTNVTESIRFSNETDRVEKKLRGTIVRTNQGDRPISANEADQVVQKINTRTAALVKKLTPVVGNQ